jgi:membrane fusion protein
VTTYNHSLYRQEAVDYAGQQLFGAVMIAQPTTLKVMSYFVIAVTALVIGFLLYGEYARKVTVNGYLRPEGGISRVYPPRSGIAKQMFFDDGDYVEKGQPLLLVDVPRSLSTGEEPYEKFLGELKIQKKQKNLAIEREERKYTLGNRWYEIRLTSLRDEQLQLQKLTRVQLSKFEIFSRQLSAIRKLRENNYVSDFQLLKIEADYLSEQKENLRMEQRLTRIDSDIEKVEYQLKLAPTLFQEKRENIRSEISEINQRAIEIRGQSEYLIKAPVAGRITAISFNKGDSVTASRPILSIQPKNADLFAWLLIPSRAVGFVDEGQFVRLMFDSFPFQQFGTQAGSIVSISGVATDSRDLSIPVSVNEPVFIAKIKLEKETVTAFGIEQSLQVDMILTADIVLAKRSIFDWMLEPLYTLRGRT